MTRKIYHRDKTKQSRKVKERAKGCGWQKSRNSTESSGKRKTEGPVQLTRRSYRQTGAVKSNDGKLLKNKEAILARWREHF